MVNKTHFEQANLASMFDIMFTSIFQAKCLHSLKKKLLLFFIEFSINFDNKNFL